MENFRPSAAQALQKAYKRGRLFKEGSLYKLNQDFDGKGVSKVVGTNNFS